jgi:hypothetical protein
MSCLLLSRPVHHQIPISRSTLSHKEKLKRIMTSLRHDPITMLTSFFRLRGALSLGNKLRAYASRCFSCGWISKATSALRTSADGTHLIFFLLLPQNPMPFPRTRPGQPNVAGDRPPSPAEDRVVRGLLQRGAGGGAEGGHIAKVHGLEECIDAAESGCEEVYRRLVNA